MGGKVLTDFFGDSDSVREIAVLPNGNIIAAGSTTRLPRMDIAVARYLSDGQLDTSFDFDGRALFRNFDISARLAVRDAAIGSDGSVVVVGDYTVHTAQMLAVRFTPEGKVDKSFGDQGRFLSGIDSTSATAVAIQKDGKILLVGTKGSGGFGGLTVLRVHPGGVLDDSFGENGVAEINHDFGLVGKPSPFAAAVQDDGKILTAGSIRIQTSPVITHLFIARLTPEGALDPEFGPGGMVTTALGTGDGKESARDIAIQPDGKIVTVGSDGEHFALVRYTVDGSPDEGFGQGGKAILDLGGFTSSIGGVALQRDCKLVVAGIMKPTLLSGRFVLARLFPDGAIDDSFGDNGVVQTSFSNSGDSEGAAAAAVQEDGKIVGAGSATVFASSDFALARYESKAGTPEDLVRDLAGLVACFQLPSGTAKSLLVKLDLAQARAADGDARGACIHLGAFENQVAALSGKRFLSESEASEILSSTGDAKAALGCGP